MVSANSSDMLDFQPARRQSISLVELQKPISAFYEAVKKLGEPMIVQKVQVDSSQQVISDHVLHVNSLPAFLNRWHWKKLKSFCGKTIN